ncbi:MAG: hypothetical protein A3G77_15905 [Acidobacteria bacterium RIFCSPLOWO2_12_FULL_68_19]|nr:MAG: hypothetical protein A3G77_15905 [Acidobacteria bacterium RIFCSPLOWO2_12_FULL_68_19]
MKKRFVRKVRRLHEGFTERLRALRHHSVWGEPRLLEMAAAGATTTLPYPHFIIIGAPKCGTSWLQGALGQHRHIIVVPDEIEYFSSNLDKYPLAWYLDHFAQRIRTESTGKATPWLVGEKSARYCSIPFDRIALVHRLLPDARLVLMTRDPVSRHWSHAKQYYSKPRVAKREGGDVLSVPRKRLFGFLTRTRILGEFSSMIANWTSVYPAERLLIVSQEHALASPRATFDAVLGYLGLPADYDPASIPLLSKQRNRGPSIPVPEDVAAFLDEMYAAERQRLRALLDNRAIVTAAETIGGVNRLVAGEACQPTASR